MMLCLHLCAVGLLAAGPATGAAAAALGHDCAAAGDPSCNKPLLDSPWQGTRALLQVRPSLSGCPFQIAFLFSPKTACCHVSRERSRLLALTMA